MSGGTWASAPPATRRLGLGDSEGAHPVGLDFAWLARDHDGNIAMFANAGLGPIPAAVLSARPEADRSEWLTAHLPRVGVHALHVQYPRPDDFIGWAERGLFAYDWSQVGRYEIIASPERPVVIGQVPPHLARLANLSALIWLRFADCPVIAPDQLAERWPKA